MTDHLVDTRRFYDLLDRLEGRIGGSRMLADCNGRMKETTPINEYAA